MWYVKNRECCFGRLNLLFSGFIPIPYSCWLPGYNPTWSGVWDRSSGRFPGCSPRSKSTRAESPVSFSFLSVAILTHCVCQGQTIDRTSAEFSSLSIFIVIIVHYAPSRLSYSKISQAARCCCLYPRIFSSFWS